jgi:hypothetical protein
MTIAVPVPLTDVQAGVNLVQFKSTDYVAISNVDLVLQGAGGGGCGANCPVATTTTLASSENPSKLGDLVTLTATVAGSSGTPTGTVTFSDSSATLATVALNGAGAATFSTASLAAGVHVLGASYSGAAGFAPSQSSSLAQQVIAPAATSTALVSSTNPALAGAAVTFTATVSSASGTPVGTVTFTDSVTTLGTARLNAAGVASFTTSSLSTGTHSITAVYAGASAFASSRSAALSQIVNAATGIQFDWENGAVQGWQVSWGQGMSIANSTAEAFSGTHSLAVRIASGETHAATDNETKSQLTAFTPGATVTLHVFNPNMTGVVVFPFAYNQLWIPAFGSGVQLLTGWNTVTYPIPAAFTAVNGIGLQVDNSGSQTGTLYLDAVAVTNVQ